MYMSVFSHAYGLHVFQVSGCAYVYMCTWTPEVDFENLQFVSILFTEAVSLS